MIEWLGERSETGLPILTECERPTTGAFVADYCTFPRQKSRPSQSGKDINFDSKKNRNR